MSRNSFIYLLSLMSDKKEGSIESQIFRLTNRIIKLTYHFRTHGKDYSSQRGLWKILGKRKRLPVYLFKTDSMNYQHLTDQLGIRRLRKK